MTFSDYLCRSYAASKIRNNLHDLSLQVAESIDNDNIFKKKKKKKKNVPTYGVFLFFECLLFMCILELFQLQFIQETRI